MGQNIAIRLVGFALLVIGLAAAGWVVYRLIAASGIESETGGGSARNTGRALAIALGLAVCGGILLFRKDPKPADRDPPRD